MMKLNKVHISAAVLLVIGLGIFITGFAMLKFDITKLSTEAPYVSKSFISSKPVRVISIEDSNADIEISPSSDGKVHVTYYENDQEYYDITESDGGDLVIKNKSHRKWYDYIFVIQLEQPRLLVEVPEDYNNDITVKSYDGYVSVRDISAHDIRLTASDDRIQVQNVTASGRLEAKASDDSIYLSDTTAAGELICHASNGKIDLDTVEGQTIEAENTDGKIVLKKVTSGESIQLKTSGDDIRLDTVEFAEELACTVIDGSVKGSVTGSLADYSVKAKAIDGSSNLPESMSGGDKVITIKASDGDIQIDFMG